MFREFIQETREQVNESWRLEDAPKWIAQNTYLRGVKYSFVDHEFQEKILSDPARIVNTQKCSQIGMSEATARWGVAVANMIPDFSVITTFPFSGDAADFAKTRIDPFIETSPKLREAIDRKMNNGEIKKFNTSLMYFRGTNGKTQAISIPADCIISDEIDRSDPHVLTQYTSRLTHSQWKLRRNFSTPTVNGYGIALEMETSLRYKNLCKCVHCNEWQLPDYYENVHIPDYTGDLKTLSKSNLPKTRYLEAFWACRKCGGVLDLSPPHRNWVCENPDSNFEAHGYYVAPADAPRIITPVDLLKASVSYSRRSEFNNQNLGLTDEDASESLTLNDLNRAFLSVGMDLRSTQLHSMGIDVGNICHITVGRITTDGLFLIVHRERCVLSKLTERKKALQKEWRVITTVIDSQPDISTVYRLQAEDKNLYGGVYSNSKKLETFTIKMFAGDEEDGKLPVHTCQINRDKCLDALMGVFKMGAEDGNGMVVIAPISAEDDEAYQKHLLDMKRVQVFDENQELVWTWVKSKDGNDHYHHSTLYLWIACQLRGTASRNFALPLSGMISTFAVKQQKLDSLLG